MAGRDSLEPLVPGHPLTEGSADPAPGDVEAILGHRFTRPELLREALTHRSAAHGHSGGGPASNERLEFIGDRVLGLLIAEWLAERFPREQEGELGRRLAHLVSQPVLAEIAGRVALPSALAVSAGEARAGVARRATVLADAMEAAIGALYLDGGLEVARRFVRRAWEPAMAGQREPPKDPKTALQEWAQARGLPLPRYELASRRGPPHAPTFVVDVLMDEHRGSGTASTKRAAEQAAARDLMRQLVP